VLVAQQHDNELIDSLYKQQQQQQQLSKQQPSAKPSDGDPF
jgi:hypothetical protein